MVESIQSVKGTLGGYYTEDITIVKHWEYSLLPRVCLAGSVEKGLIKVKEPQSDLNQIHKYL